MFDDDTRPRPSTWNSRPMPLPADTWANSLNRNGHDRAAQLASAGACTFDQRAAFMAAAIPAFGGRMVTKDRRETRHGLHLLLTLCTFGVWAVTGWPIAWAWNRFGPRRVTTTNYR